jgi:hypothetical protein
MTEREVFEIGKVRPFLTNQKFTVELKDFKFYPENLLKAYERMTPKELAAAQKAWDERDDP